MQLNFISLIVLFVLVYIILCIISVGVYWKYFKRAQKVYKTLHKLKFYKYSNAPTYWMIVSEYGSFYINTDNEYVSPFYNEKYFAIDTWYISNLLMLWMRIKYSRWFKKNIKFDQLPVMTLNEQFKMAFSSEKDKDKELGI